MITDFANCTPVMIRGAAGAELQWITLLAMGGRTEPDRMEMPGSLWLVLETARGVEHAAVWEPERGRYPRIYPDHRPDALRLFEELKELAPVLEPRSHGWQVRLSGMEPLVGGHIEALMLQAYCLHELDRKSHASAGSNSACPPRWRIRF